MTSLTLSNLRVEHEREPMGIDVELPSFSWELQSEEKNTFQTHCRICVFQNGKSVWDTKKTQTQESLYHIYNGEKLLPLTTYNWQVEVWDNHNKYAIHQSFFETGHRGEPWQTKWVEPVQEANVYVGEKHKDYNLFKPAQYLRLPICVNKQISKARIYATAHGIYKMELNGKVFDDRHLAPEITPYEEFLMYQTYDITSNLQMGNNMLGIILGDGWWSGCVGITGESCQYGDKIGLLLECRLTYDDGTIEIISGENCVSTTGPIVFSDIFVGEKYDANKELINWSTTRYNDDNWQKVNPVDYGFGNLKGQYGQPVRSILSFEPESVIITPKGETVLDLGQVIAGKVAFTINAEQGHLITLEHSEVLDSEGNFVNNIMGVNKQQTDFYITKSGLQTYNPVFTYHGFRYVRISGFPCHIKTAQFTAYVLSSDVSNTGSLETSNPKINRLQKNIWWSQVANTISIPTDCPQRERAGWTGDILVFAPTLVYNRDGQSFLRRWLESCRHEQMDDGAIPLIVPYLKGYRSISKQLETHTSCGWGDAIVAVPWAVYNAYGDKQILSENYNAMKKWMAYVQNQAETQMPDGYESFDEDRKARQKYLWNTGFHWGDWLVPSIIIQNSDAEAMGQTAYATKDVVAPVYYAYTTDLMAQIAKELENEEDYNYFTSLNAKIKKAFAQEYIHEDGTLNVDLQGIYVMCLKNNLVPEHIKPLMIEHLIKMIKENNGCLDTGFLSIHFLMDALCEANKREEAFKLLYQENCPSWLYEVSKGATTIWEAWHAILPTGEVSNYSYNHYAFGCVGDWMYREIGGIKAVKAGYKVFLVNPALDSDLSYANASLNSPYGKIKVSWQINNGCFALNVTVPVNTTAQVVVPENALMNGIVAKVVNGICEINSGEYLFSYSI